MVKNPGTLLRELIGPGDSEGGLSAVITEFQSQTGINLLNDVAANLGGEMTVAFDGPLLPTPSWKVAIEVDNPARLEWAIEQAVKTAQQHAPAGSPAVSQGAVQLETLQVNGMTGHALKSPSLPFEIDYVFTDGYLLIGSSQTVLEAAIESRTSGLTLARSSAFRAQLPQDGHVNFSGLLYYNMGSMAGPVVDQLKAGGLMTPEQQKSAGSLTSNRAPGLIYALRRAGSHHGGEPRRVLRLGPGYTDRIECEGSGGAAATAPAEFHERCQWISKTRSNQTQLTITHEPCCRVGPPCGAHLGAC